MSLDIANGEVLTDRPHHRHQEFLAFLRQIDSNVPAELNVHLALDNYATHGHAKVKAWLGRHPRHLTYASWLNQVKRWFGLITQRAILGGSFSGVKELIAKIDQFVSAYNKKARLFVWIGSGDSILEKIQRLCRPLIAFKYGPK